LAALRFGRPYPAESLFQAWQKQLLYHEHSFGMRDGPGPEGRRMYAWKIALAEQAGAAARLALDEALRAFAAEIPNHGENRVAVFNSLSFPVSDIAEIRLEGKLAQGRLAVVDVQTGRPALSERGWAAGGMVLRFRADDVPALGYRTYRIEQAAAAEAPAAVADEPASTALENEFLRLVLAADGTMASLVDRHTGKEMLDLNSPHRGNQFIFMNDAWQPASPRRATIRSAPRGSLEATLEVQAEPTGIFPALSSRYTLYAGLNRLEIENSFTKAPGRSGSNETVFYAFPFAAPKGRFCLDMPGVVARYADDFRPETDWTIMPMALGNIDPSLLR